MKNFLISISIASLIISCCSTANIKGFKKVSYVSNFQTNSKSKPFEKRKFFLNVPKNFKILNEDFNPEFKEVVYLYQNGAKIYLTDNNLNGSPLNGDNKLNQGISYVQRKNLNDSISMHGKQKDGNYWREDILNEVVIGYLNVPEDMKSDFDKAILSLKRN